MRETKRYTKWVTNGRIVKRKYEDGSSCVYRETYYNDGTIRTSTVPFWEVPRKWDMVENLSPSIEAWLD